MPYVKPNNVPQYIHSKSNHPPGILKNIPESINKHLSEISSDEGSFKKPHLSTKKASTKVDITISSDIHIHHRQHPKLTIRGEIEREILFGTIHPIVEM